ncbi:GNAT family N-acetyltransferase [Pseudoalteromonas sp. SCSIO 43101]|uniref:GNAT family N-acetyltransferase n=1 Tax=Pseudoalteromonas sp. SCSIO 43101 TaxID=2822847 RepID=UPI00202B5449|nr:GNAT family N-acetyltransferase [Pseudoalteromonas sp. SCSIO 43101]URQ90142.1 GNAT family N-acetyltransferase [Pseudoalteromonas sp. SCSIO 43101]
MSIKYIKWDGNEQHLSDYLSLMSEVYKQNFSLDEFIWKHKRSPLGPSLIYLAYSNKKLIAARAMLPVYHQEFSIYQPCDTVTHPKFRRMGLFSKLTKFCLENIDLNVTQILNFPNNSSYPAYTKLGWEHLSLLSKQYSFGFPSVKKIKARELTSFVKKNFNKAFADYLIWRFYDKPNNVYSYYFDQNHLYIGKKFQYATVSFSDGNNKNGTKNGVQYSMHKAPFLTRKCRLTFTLSSQARVAYYPCDNIDIIDVFDVYSPLAIMDTF